ncbi:RluA family pseudouridine synthase [Herbivorax sp. ANBcel31]|uniref:RluA family pseudouridine synthase n=1 Tax=Herbivorax sp. ANBcel31 TaxID=3069754 RepID=UPI0027ADDE4C|nr:RluA family pseudouridine synthase [Herbivorax sp. ANBcel31]MDQ2086857.1 RluA family pseudouridine synthase [Herbivorax sp. ANBcel31]
MVKREKIDVIYEDNHLLVVKKPVNMPVQRDSTNDEDMLTALKGYIKEKYNKPGNVYLGLVHRLDRPVGGLMVFARTSKAASRLSDFIRKREFYKRYLAVIHGVLKDKSGKMEDYLLKDKSKNTVNIVSESTKGAKYACLEYNVLNENNNFSLVKINLHTGRPHQIRVQFSKAGHPLYGDQKYGRKLNSLGQQIALWSNEISFIHPTTKKKIEFKCKPPEDKPWNCF